MRIIAIINQKGGVGKTTTVANLGAALALAGKRVVVFDMDPQANLSLYLGSEVGRGDSSVYGVLTEGLPISDALRKTSTKNLSLVASHLDLSGAELELASTLGRETLLRDAISLWISQHTEDHGEPPADYVLLDCPPSLGLLSINALVAADEVMIAVQTEFFALQGLSKLVEVIQLLRRRMNPALVLSGIIPCLYDNRLKLAREVLVELRRYFPDKVFKSAIRTNVRLAESPSHSKTIFEYAPESNGAQDYARLGAEILELAAQSGFIAPKPATNPIVAAADEQAKELHRAAEGLAGIENTPPKSAPPIAPLAPKTLVESQVDNQLENHREPASDPQEEGLPSTPKAPAGRDEVDAELAAYELPRPGVENKNLAPKRHDFGANIGPITVPRGIVEADPSTTQHGPLDAGVTDPDIDAAGSEVSPTLTPTVATLEVEEPELQNTHAESEPVEAESPVEAQPKEALAEPPLQTQAEPQTAPAECPDEPQLEVSPTETIETEPDPTPAPTPVYGFGAYIGEDRWTRQPQKAKPAVDR